MRALRFVGYLLLFVAASLATAVTVLVRNQGKIAEIALARIESRTGLAIRITGTRIGFGTRLVVVLEQPRVTANGVEVATLDDVRAVLSYRAILLHSGLPLAGLVLERPLVRVPVSAPGVSLSNLPLTDLRIVATLKWVLDALSDTARRVDVVDAILSDENGAVLVDHLDLSAHRNYPRPAGNWPWLVDLDLALDRAPLRGLRLTAALSLEPQTPQPDVAASGQLWFWGIDLGNFALGAIKISASMVGAMNAVLRDGGVLRGRTELKLGNLRVETGPQQAELALGDYVAAASFEALPDLLDLPAISLQHNSSQVLEGKISVSHPFSETRALSLDVAGATIDLAQVVQSIGTTNTLLSRFSGFLNSLSGGQFVLTHAALNSPIPLRDWTPTTVRDHLTVDATIRKVGYRLPKQSLLPSLTDLGAEMNYSSGVLKVRQGSGMLGGSQITDLSAEANLQKAPAQISYKCRVKANLDLGQLYSAMSAMISTANPAIANRVAKLEGRLPLGADSSGQLPNLTWTPPRNYKATLAFGNVTVTLKNPSVKVGLRDGSATVTPGLISLNRIRLVPGDGKSGDVVLNGTIEPQIAPPLVHNLTVEMHRVLVQQWLPFVVSSDALTADGPVSGLLTANSAPTGKRLPVVTGKLTLGTGDLQLGFLRSPIVTSSATLNLDGKGLTLNVPAGTLEQAPLDLKLAVADFANPILQLDATLGKLDLEVMRFIRLPWSPRVPPHFFAVPAFGHIEARTAKFGIVPMAQVSTDFHRDNASWHVENFKAQVFGGALNLRIDGRTGPDNWIHMVGKIANMDAGGPFLLRGQVQQPPITGKLAADADLWADTDVDFFETLAGTAGLQVVDGVLNRFTLLTRILGLIDLKSWLTANFPNPLIAGLPFTNLKADLKGVHGDFYTDNLRLEGPVMNIRAKGDVRFGDGQVNMEIGVFPFNTANWIVHHIPIVGPHLAEGSKELVAAYFHVHGPYSNPSVTPKPITSVTQFVKKMLGLPVNIIAPNTIK